MSLLPVAPSPPNPFPSTSSSRDNTLSPLAPSPPSPRLLRSPRWRQQQQQQKQQQQQGRITTTTPLQNTVPCMGQTWRNRRAPQHTQNGPRQRRAASGVDAESDVHVCYRPSMAGWWVCCQCSNVNNPGLTPEKCPTCDHSLCKYYCEIFR